MKIEEFISFIEGGGSFELPCAAACATFRPQTVNGTDKYSAEEGVATD